VSVLIRYGVGWGVPGSPGDSHGGVLVTVDDALALERDRLLNGDVFLRPTDERSEGGEVIYRRLAPADISPV
jgi:hypothetical protein